MEQLCKLFGLTRQAWYAAARRQEKKCFHQDLILQEVKRIRSKIPGIGTAKLHEVMQGFIRAHQLKLGRDKLHKLLKNNSLLSNKKRKRIKTTDSDHCYYKYPNRAKNLVPSCANILWVSDLTYISVGSNFVYLSVIMDAYSRKIVGWHLDKTMEAQGSVRALDMALLSRGKSDKPLIHHSDRGVQYCSWKYVDRLRDHGVTISMTQSGDPNENAMAERLFRTLKGDFEIRGFVSFSSAYEAVEKAINNYNAMRPHASLGYLTPHQAHYRTGPLPLKWYPYKKIRFGNVHYPDHYQKTG
ncbi:IS3 family transposase [Dyadobacter psychrotolerans]|uniref:IS3 family transposase n=2 Tax=Dyadobacter psychrotolerans TaxID=2541721 RepID=A0A4R5D6X0_9BACT|nr:IS3 family transposase [Dyadobacter psychrotolerans]TDE07421.1 IS3 family transposase [Dyadobacter psychrotolerans]